MQRISICRRGANPFWGRATRLSTQIGHIHRLRLLHTSQKLSGQNEAPIATEASEQRPNVFRSLSLKSAQPSHQGPVKSSITNEERRIFATIRQKFGGAVNGVFPQRDSQSDRKGSQGLPLYDLEVDKILSLFAPEIENSSINFVNFEPVQASNPSHTPEVETETDSDSDSNRSTPNLATPAEVRSTAYNVLNEISTNIIQNLRGKTPSSEEALWTYINTEIFPIVTLLQHPLLRPTANSFHRPYQLTLGELTSSNAETPLQVPTCLAEVPPQTPVLPLITILYPAATLLAMRMYAAYLPHSDYGFALYPSIQNLGTTSFLLGANVHFFNSLIQLQWEVYSDLTEIKALLGDMRNSVVPYDAQTLAILRAIVEDSKSAGDDGRAKEWWDQTAQKSDINGLSSYWLPRVEKSLRKDRAVYGPA